MEDRPIYISANSVQATNAAGPLRSRVERNELHATIHYDTRAHVSVQLFDQALELDHPEDIRVQFEVHASEPMTLWLAFVESHNQWHKPIGRQLRPGWQTVQLCLADFVPAAIAFRILKFIIRQDCKLVWRDFRVLGLPLQLTRLHVVIPWYGSDPARLRARRIALQRLEEQSLPFRLTVVELLTRGEPTFQSSKAHHEHILQPKDRSYEGIFHKESLYNCFITTTKIEPSTAYLFLDGDVYAEDHRWLERALDKANAEIKRHGLTLLQPFNRVRDDTTGKSDLSFARVHDQSVDTLAVNPGLCWLLPGELILTADLRFPHRLVTGIGDAAFVNRYVATSSALPHLPPFAAADAASSASYPVAWLDAELTHVNHGREAASGYALRHLIWQACLDRAMLMQPREPLLKEDDDGFMHFAAARHPAQRCLARISALDSPDAVRADVLRSYGNAPYADFQLLAPAPTTDLEADPRSLGHPARAAWEVSRAIFRLRCLGVEYTTLPSAQQHSNKPVRDLVSEYASHDVVLLTEAFGFVYPSTLPGLRDQLEAADVVLVTGTVHRLDVLSRAPQLLQHPPGDSSTQQPVVVAIAFRLSWWEQNEHIVPHGLRFGGNGLACLIDLLKANYDKLPTVKFGARMIVDPAPAAAHKDHNETVTAQVSDLLQRGFLKFGPVDAKRRKIRVQPRYSWQHHYSGDSLIQALEGLERRDGVLFHPAVDPAFSYLEDEPTAILEPWVGIMHGLFDYPAHLPHAEHGMAQTLRHPALQQSFLHCRGIFVYSEYLRSRLLASPDWPATVPIEVLPHTTLPPGLTFRAGRFANGSADLYAVGFYGKRLHTFYDLDAGRFKKWLLAPMDKPVYRKYLQCELALARTQDGVTRLERVSRSDYEELLSSNPVFLDFYDLSASNTLTECIVRNTPMLIRRHPAAVEVLGADYPLFFESLEEASALLCESQLLAAHEHLAGIDNNAFYHDAFVERLAASEIYRCL